MDGSKLQQAAAEYADLGWRVFPLSVRSKVPRKGWDNWQNRASSDSEHVEELWEKLPGSNIAVQLGEASGIIDIECDSEAGEQWLVEMFGGPENLPVTPTFVSSTKSGTPGKHRLFRFTTELPNNNKGHWRPKTTDGVKQDVDFKVGGNAKGTYSLFPPSIHPDTGEEYRWLITPDEADIAELSEEFVARLFDALYGEGGSPDQQEAKPAEHWLDIAGGVQEGGRNNAAAEFIGLNLGMLADPFNNKNISIQWELIRSWNELKNQPPLDEAELKTVFESILRRHRESFTGHHAINDMAQRDQKTGEVSKKPWMIVRVLSEPATWKLFSPLWPELNGDGFIVLSTEQLVSPGKIKAAAAEQAGVGLPGWFVAFWNGTKKEPGQFERLMASHTTEEASAEDKRSHVVAEMIHSALNQNDGRTVEEGEELNPRGINRLPDGSCWFVFSNLLETRLQSYSEPVTRKELSSLHKQLGVESKNRQNVRYCVYSEGIQKQLREMALFGSEPVNEDRCAESQKGAHGRTSAHAGSRGDEFT